MLRKELELEENLNHGAKPFLGPCNCLLMSNTLVIKKNVFPFK